MALKTPTQHLQTLGKPLALTAEDQVELRPYMRAITLLQEYPDIALIALSGIFIPPHQRTTMYALHVNHASRNVNISSRGTAKSSTVCVLYANYKQLCFAKRHFVTLSATGFRGGQIMFEDTEKWAFGGWSSQDPKMQFFVQSNDNPNFIHRAQNFWMIEYDSLSDNMTVPTNDEQRLRGLRGTDLLIDEANTMDEELVTKVAQSFLNVKGDFEHGGAYSAQNQTYFTSTIDFNWRWLQGVMRAAQESLRRELEAKQALERNDHERYLELLRIGLHGYSYVSFDYTDMLIRTTVATREGVQYKVRWPNPKIPVTRDERGIPYIVKDAAGQIIKFGSPVEYYATYPVDKGNIEDALFDGTVDEATWWAEQRNITDSASGDVYSHTLIDKASCMGGNFISSYDHMTAAWKEKHAADKSDYFAPVLYRCADPCVIGVDYATQSDFTAFVVMRLGPLASGEYDFTTGTGKTKWSNVIWAEQYRRMTHQDVAKKLQELRGRYNLVYFHDPHVTDTWDMCRAIGLDMRGGGSGVRDELAQLNKAHVQPPDVRIYDPLDRDERILAYAADANAIPMLDAIWPSAELNTKLVNFTVAQMENGLLYLPRYLDRSQRPPHQNELDIGYEACHNLTWQLRRLRKEMQQNWPKFYIEGDTSLPDNKKDLWSAFIYAAKQARAHIIRQGQEDKFVPAYAALAVNINSKRSTPASWELIRRSGRRL